MFNGRVVAGMVFTFIAMSVGMHSREALVYVLIFMIVCWGIYEYCSWYMRSPNTPNEVFFGLNIPSLGINFGWGLEWEPVYEEEEEPAKPELKIPRAKNLCDLESEEFRKQLDERKEKYFLGYQVYPETPLEEKNTHQLVYEIESLLRKNQCDPEVMCYEDCTKCAIRKEADQIIFLIEETIKEFLTGPLQKLEEKVESNVPE